MVGGVFGGDFSQTSRDPVLDRCDETPHCAHLAHHTTSRRERQVTGRFGEPVNGGPKFSYRMPSMAGYSYGNSFDVRIKRNTDPNLTPNPIRTHDRAPNPNRPMSQKKTLRPVGVVKHGNWIWDRRLQVCRRFTPSSVRLIGLFNVSSTFPAYSVKTQACISVRCMRCGVSWHPFWIVYVHGSQWEEPSK